MPHLSIHKLFSLIAVLALFIVASGSADAQVCSPAVCIGTAKDASFSGRAVEYTVYVENLGTEALNGITLSDDLDVTFGTGNYTVTAAPIRVSGPASIVPNAGFDGSADINLLSSGSLSAGATAQLRFSLEINILGTFFNSVEATATGAVSAAPAQDFSDAGTDPDPNGNGDPTDPGEDDTTGIDTQAQPRIGAAKAANVSGTQITLDFVVENFGNRDLSNLSLTDDLDATFGAGNYTLAGVPTVTSGATVVANAGFNGSSDPELIDPGSTLATGASAMLELLVNITNPADLGAGLGVYANQATAAAETLLGQPAADLSHEGFNPDPNGNGIPTEGGENQPTAIVLGEEPQIGVAKTATVTGSTITFDIILENLGNVTLAGLSLEDDLNAVFGAGNYFVSSAPALVQNPGTLSLNAGFDGNFDVELLAGGTLAAGAVARIQLDVSVIAIADLGSGTGVYANQVLAEAVAPGGGVTFDLSDDGTDPDPNANGDPGEIGEDDASAFSIAPVASMGIAKQYISGGNAGGTPLVYLQFTLTNYGNQTISNITITDDLNAVYGAGNYTHFEDPSQVTGSPTLNYNAAYNGSTNTALLSAGSFLAPGESATFRTAARIINITDQGFGSGIYQNQVTVNALDPAANPVADISHAGADPDPNGDNNPAEMDPTVIDVNQVEALGIARNATVAGNQVTFDLYLENLGSIGVSQISITERLDPVFGAGNYFVSSAPLLIDDPGTLALNTGLTGNGDADFLLAGNSSLAPGDTAQLRFTVEVINLSNAQGLGVGVYSTQSEVIGLSAQGALLSDLSDAGTDPDANGNGNPSEAGEDDATTFSIAGSTLIGVAKTAAVSGFTVTIDLFVENLGAETLTGVSLSDDLAAALGSGNFALTTLPALIVDPGTVTLNPLFDGDSDVELFAAGSTLNAGATLQLRFDFTVTTESDQGNGFGVYQNQAVAAALLPSGITVSDFSDAGIDPDPNGNGDPSDAGEDDSTTIVITGNPAIGIAKKATVMGTVVVFDFYVENLGDVTLSNIMLSDPLNPVFGSGNFSILSQPFLIAGPATLSLSPQFFGFNIFDRVILGGFLRPGELAVFRIRINVNNVSDVGNGFGIYFNGVTITATDPGGNSLADTSDDGVLPDPNGNGNGADAGEDDPTQIIIGDEANIGVAKTASAVDQTITVDLYLENLGGSTLSDLSLPDDLDSVFGAGNYMITSAPVLIDDPGTINLNGGFNGSTDIDLITAGMLAALDTAQIQFTVDVTPTDQGLGLGSYSNQVTITALTPLGSVAVDVSDSGTDPDPNGDGLAVGFGESDPTTFSVGTTRVGVAKNATVSGNQVILDYYVENLGSTVFSGVSLEDDLDVVFGAGNYRLVSGPTIESPPRAIVPNTGYNGSSDIQLIGSGGLGLGVTEQIRIVLEIDTLTDGGSGVGVYTNQVTVNADASSDLSDAGIDPDPNGNGDAAEAGENDPTVFTVGQNPLVGLAKNVVVTGRTVMIDFYLESFANVAVSNLSLVDNLDAVFGAGNYTLTSVPVLLDDPGTLVLNGGFDGSGAPDVLAAGSTLAPGATAQIRFAVRVDTVTDQGGGPGVYANQATVSAQSSDGTTLADLSAAGIDPDPNGNGDPAEAGEDDPTTIVLEGSITGQIFNDLDGNGVAAGEPGLSGVGVFLDLNGNGIRDGAEPVQTSAADGSYVFPNLAAGTYSVVVDASSVPAGFVLTGGMTPVSLSLSAGENAVLDFGYQQQNASIGDLIWNDLNGNGMVDTGEPGLAGVSVFIDTNTNGVADAGEPAAISAANGTYDFTGLTAGTYLVAIEAGSIPAAFTLTSISLTRSVELAAGADFNDADFGFQQQNAGIGDLVWDDQNMNGVFDTGEPGLASARVYLDLNGNGFFDPAEPAQLTDALGQYNFTGLAAGVYTVRVDLTTVPLIYALTTGNQPLSVTLAAGEIFSDADFGFAQQPEPGFGKAFASASIALGDSVTLTFTIDNSANAFAASGLDFADVLPGGMRVATPDNASVTCSGGLLTAVPGTTVISYSGGSVTAGAVCTVMVDVVVAAAGMYINTSGELTSSLGNSGTAAAILRVADNSLVLSKRFVSGPVLPGGNVILRYTIENRSDVFTVVQIAFSDDLDQALTGLARVSTESVNSCGSAVVITGTTTLTFGNGSLPPGAICVFDILVAVPADAVAASYPGASSAVTASAGGVAIAGSAASADLVVAFPDFAKTFTAIAEVGGSVDLVFTIGNPDPVNAATGLTFSDDLEQMGTDFTAPGLPLSNVCGTGSLLSGSRRIVLTAGSVAAGASCQFSVTVNLPASADSGTFVNVTSPLDFIVNGQNITGNQTGAATASLEVVTDLVEVPLLNGWVLLLCALIMASAGAFRLRRRQ